MPPGTRVSAARMKALGIDVNTVCSMKMKKILLMAMAVAAILYKRKSNSCDMAESKRLCTDTLF